MFVKNWMSENVVTVFPDTLLSTAADIISTKNIKHLPVINSGNILKGIVTSSDIRKAFGKNTSTENIRVDEIMSYTPITISEYDTLDDALLLIYQNMIGALPVIDSNFSLMGIIARYDILRAMVKIMSLEEVGSRIDVVLEDKPGMLEELAIQFKQMDINIISIMTVHAENNSRIVSVRIDSIFKKKVENHLISEGFKIYEPWKEGC
ncbi:putative signal transduction protein with CBS domains [Flexistipes sinusarabici DSM 4947]|uniref:Signal transduction protein with CBS domains n=1 Tax=Flexistipes sinusarabici (strain ATCC 49648 / DSM 4947 / MAS 10) TaxID=717231 RepID=F8E4K7_FLESM|nr:CBS domain-containing protein [Flexistipes sinusarabici]AEI14493.1 putative signal transduction protein with CBS domains [Flexistipes sinusarabici DSM 4947]